MISSNSSYSLLGINVSREREYGLKRIYLYWFCAFWLLIAFLEFGQDYFSSVLNENQFRLAESLSYKLFWLLFIPFSLLLIHSLGQFKKSLSRNAFYAVTALIILFGTLIHLAVFSLFLHGISNLIHENAWSLSFLITEKLSTRLYIGLICYLMVSFAYILLTRRKPVKQRQRKYSNTITVKRGRKSKLIDTDTIKWISSDGQYLTVHTTGKKHVIIDSLKHIIKTLPENFRRIHRSTIVNIDRIKELESRGNGDYDIIMDDARTLRLSRNYAKPLRGTLL